MVRHLNRDIFYLLLNRSNLAGSDIYCCVALRLVARVDLWQTQVTMEPQCLAFNGTARNVSDVLYDMFSGGTETTACGMG